MKDYETIARNSHRSGVNCAASVYNAFANDNKNAPHRAVGMYL